jgi:hypothetical protein
VRWTRGLSEKGGRVHKHAFINACIHTPTYKYMCVYIYFQKRPFISLSFAIKTREMCIGLTIVATLANWQEWKLKLFIFQKKKKHEILSNEDPSK